MQSTSTLFFQPKQSSLSNENNLERFLLNFPETEFWRFFIERERYDYRQELLIFLYRSLHDDKDENTPLTVMEDKIRKLDLTIADIYTLAKNNTDITNILNTHHLQHRTSEKILDYINKHQAWLGFEIDEPGYFLHLAEGLKFILLNIMNPKRPFNSDFIKELHKICTLNVKNMVKDSIPGQYRTSAAIWPMEVNYDSLQGLSETIHYLKTIEKTYKIYGLRIDLIAKDSKSLPVSLSHFENKDADTIAKTIWDALASDNIIIEFIAKEYDSKNKFNLDNSRKFLEVISNNLIEDLEKSLKSAESKQEKLTAIFTYLKHIVLHHPFADGVGRTYSMLVLQYLLMRENLLPIIIKNSNIIPGYSVNELVEEYLRAEKEMEHILKDNSYINNELFANPNINTLTLFEKISPEEKAVFNASLAIYKETKSFCLSAIQENNRAITGQEYVKKFIY